MGKGLRVCARDLDGIVQAVGGGVGLRIYIARLVGVVLRLDLAYGYHPDDGATPKLYFSLRQPL